MDLPPTADERIAGTASEYARISKNLVLISSEIVLVDPYLNPLKRDCQAVLEALFLIAAQGRNQKIILWTRAAEVYGPGSNESTESTESDIRDLLFRLARRTKFKPGSEIHMNFVEDEARRTKMHARYLLSIKGGIRFDQGFQQLPQGRRVDVGPIGKATHDELFDIYFEGRHDMSVVQRITLKI